MKISALLASALLVCAVTAVQACPYGSKQITRTDDMIKFYVSDTKDADKQTIIDKKTLKGDFATTVEPDSKAN